MTYAPSSVLTGCHESRIFSMYIPVYNDVHGTPDWCKYATFNAARSLDTIYRPLAFKVWDGNCITGFRMIKRAVHKMFHTCSFCGVDQCLSMTDFTLESVLYEVSDSKHPITSVHRLV